MEKYQPKSIRGLSIHIELPFGSTKKDDVSEGYFYVRLKPEEITRMKKKEMDTHSLDYIGEMIFNRHRFIDIETREN
jgi:hypothetical protein